MQHREDVDRLACGEVVEACAAARDDGGREHIGGEDVGCRDTDLCERGRLRACRRPDVVATLRAAGCRDRASPSIELDRAEQAATVVRIRDADRPRSGLLPLAPVSRAAITAVASHEHVAPGAQCPLLESELVERPARVGERERLHDAVQVDVPVTAMGRECAAGPRAPLEGDGVRFAEFLARGGEREFARRDAGELGVGSIQAAAVVPAAERVRRGIERGGLRRSVELIADAHAHHGAHRDERAARQRGIRRHQNPASSSADCREVRYPSLV